MKVVGSILWGIIKFVLLLPFRILALIAGFVIGVIGIMVQLITNMGAAVIGLFNLLLLVCFLATLFLKDYSLLPSFLIFIGGEAIILMVVGLAAGVLGIIRDCLFDFAFGRPIDVNLSDI